ncbi:MAG: YdcF family protein [Inquilinus sp.]|nr:YdcF family protein [Inquilinus sp.]
MSFRDRRRWSPPLFLLLVLLVSGLAAWGTGFVVFARRAAAVPQDSGRVTDAIIVLTGGSLRLTTGLSLLEAEQAEKLFVSGVYRGVDVEELLRVSRQAPAAVECCVVLGYAAGDTRGNAEESANWLRSQGYRSFRLVTANYHMPRSLLEFRRVLPEAEIVAHPVAPSNVHVEQWWRWPGTTALLIGEYNKYLVARLRGVFE